MGTNEEDEVAISNEVEESTPEDVKAEEPESEDTDKEAVEEPAAEDIKEKVEEPAPPVAAAVEPVKVEPVKVEPVKEKPVVKGKPVVKEKPVVNEKVVEPTTTDDAAEVKETVAPVVDSSKGISSVKQRILELQGKGGKASVPLDAEVSL